MAAPLSFLPPRSSLTVNNQPAGRRGEELTRVLDLISQLQMHRSARRQQQQPQHKTTTAQDLAHSPWRRRSAPSSPFSPPRTGAVHMTIWESEAPNIGCPYSAYSHSFVLFQAA